jgi:hypothetical protein
VRNERKIKRNKSTELSHVISKWHSKAGHLPKAECQRRYAKGVKRAKEGGIACPTKDNERLVH